MWILWLYCSHTIFDVITQTILTWRFNFSMQSLWFQSNNLTSHKRREHTESVYLCDKCDYKSKVEKYFSKHNEGTITYWCDSCSYQTIRKSLQKQHGESNHSESQIQCNHCEYTYSSKRPLQKHITSKHEGKIFSRPDCGCVYVKSHTLDKHEYSVHNGVKVDQLMDQDHGRDSQHKLAGEGTAIKLCLEMFIN